MAPQTIYSDCEKNLHLIFNLIAVNDTIETILTQALILSKVQLLGKVPLRCVPEFLPCHQCPSIFFCRHGTFSDVKLRNANVKVPL
jgi:hypothetical protein